MEPRDAFIAATAEVHGLTLVTLNASDFEAIIRDILTPRTSASPSSLAALSA
jgi:predicted nucleic acid-binding protein